ncbi:MAG TPA: hypothetical protein VGK19_15590 [Capsulimonadaceae bacterium]
MNLTTPTKIVALSVIFSISTLLTTHSAPALAAPAEVHIIGFKDAGGLVAFPGEAPLNDQLNTGLAKYLRRGNASRLTVTTPGEKATAAASPQFDLEGDISHTVTGTEDGGPYLWVLRLYKLGTPRTLVNQWAGTARTYLDITSNTHKDSSVPLEGLIGALGDRVIAAVTAVQPDPVVSSLGSLIDKTTDAKRFDAAVTVDGAKGPVSIDAPIKLHPGDKFRVGVTAHETAMVFVVAYGPDGLPFAAFVPKQGQEAYLDADKPTTVPGDRSFVVDSVSGPTDKRYVVLVRKSAGPVQHVALDPTAQGANMGSFGDGLGERAPSVRVLDIGPGAPKTAKFNDPGIRRIVDMSRLDPEGTWASRTITVHVEP